MNSLVIVLFLSGMVAMIMLRTLHKDIARYNQVDQVRSFLITVSVVSECTSDANRKPSKSVVHVGEGAGAQDIY